MALSRNVQVNPFYTELLEVCYRDSLPSSKSTANIQQICVIRYELFAHFRSATGVRFQPTFTTVPCHCLFMFANLPSWLASAETQMSRPPCKEWSKKSRAETFMRRAPAKRMVGYMERI
jgi:hypothetical protein